MSRGTVYVLINESMPNLVKIGMTTRSVSQRMAELYQTGVPTPFELYAEYDCPDCSQVESEVHDSLNECRVNGSREFFVCPPEKAALEVMNAQREQVDIWLDDFIPNQIIVDTDMHIDEADILVLADKLGAPHQDVISAFYMMTPEEFKPALDRWHKLVAERHLALVENRQMPPLRSE
jgi:hypothetical protein